MSIQDSGMSIFQTNIFVNNFRFNLGVEYEAKCTMIIVEPDCLKIIKESKDYNRQASVVSQVNYWISIKTWFMKHFSEIIEDGEGNDVRILLFIII